VDVKWLKNKQKYKKDTKATKDSQWVFDLYLALAKE
jgi:hypothetical protein